MLKTIPAIEILDTSITPSQVATLIHHDSTVSESYYPDQRGPQPTLPDPGLSDMNGNAALNLIPFTRMIIT